MQTKSSGVAQRRTSPKPPPDQDRPGSWPVASQASAANFPAARRGIVPIAGQNHVVKAAGEPCEHASEVLFLRGED